MADIVLVNIPPWGVVMPPLGIAYLSAYLKSKGISVDVCDMNVRLYNRADAGQKKFWRLDTINTMEPAVIASELFRSFEPMIRVMIDDLSRYPVIGFSANNLISAVVAGILAQDIKKRGTDTRIIVGGPGCFHGWDRNTMSLSAIDYVVIGEGEEALFRLVRAIQQKNPAAAGGIPGVFGVAQARQKQFVPPVAVGNLDNLPFPTFEEFDMSCYGEGRPYRPLPMLMSRGCINQCSYCIDCRMNFPFRTRNADQIIAEIKHHVQRYGITHVEFNDLLCNGNLHQLEKICDGLIGQDLHIRWISYAAIRKI
jgi:Fe-S oxidoreductase